MNPALGLAAARVVIGSVALAAPRTGTKLFSLDAAANPQLPYMTQMFGSREVLLGAVVLLTNGRTRRNLVLAGVAVDAADALAAALAGRARAVDTTTAAMLAGPALAAVAGGVAGLRSAP